jgi:hypothetical protein
VPKSAVSNNFDWEDTVRPILIAIMLLFATNGAFALSKHETDMALIDAALPTAKLTPSQRAEVVRDRQEGAQFHYSGKHGQAEVVLEKAKRILKIH